MVAGKEPASTTTQTLDPYYHPIHWPSSAILLAPLVTWLERWIGRIAAVLLVVLLIFTAPASGGWVLTRQLVELATKLPGYKGNIIAKMHSFEVPKGGIFTKLSETVDELKKELPGGPAPAAPMVTQETGKPGSIVLAPPQQPAPVPMQRIESLHASPLELVQLIVSPLLGPLGMAAPVLVLVIFMLLQREDSRSRLIRLIGLGRISATTRALEDAGHRVSRYLLMQLFVNLTYGVFIALGLSFIGVPNSVLWGAFGNRPPLYPVPRTLGRGCSADAARARGFAVLDHADPDHRAVWRPRAAPE